MTQLKDLPPFDGDISKLAVCRKKPEREFRQEYETGTLRPLFENGEALLSKSAAEKLRTAVDEIRQKDLPGKQVVMPVMLDNGQIKELVMPIIRQHLGRFIGRKLWEKLFEMCDGQLPFVLEERTQRLVVIESPFGHPTKVGMEENAAYGRMCMRDSLKRGEAPYASHLLYTQCLDDLKTDERKQGMEAGFAWGRAAQHVAVYIDRGVSKGMLEGIKRHQAAGKTIEFRSINK